jgi:hypothetical protein
VNGNVIRYTYDTTSSAGVAYLKRIEYGQGTKANRSVEFILNDPGSAPRPDKPVTARAGFRQQTDRRVTSIEVRAASSALVTRYDLTYSQDPDSPEPARGGPAHRGDGVAALLHRVRYSPTRARPPTRSKRASPRPRRAQPGRRALRGQDPAGVVASIADMNRDGPAICTRSRTPGTPRRRATVALERAPLSPWTRSELFGLGNLAARPERRSSASLFSEALAGSAVLDFDGDGYLDHLLVAGFPYGAAPRYLRRGSPAGFIDPPLHTSFELPHAWGFDLETWVHPSDFPYIRISETDDNGNVDVTAAMVDVTGDGRPDLVRTNVDGPYSYFDGSSEDPTGPLGTWRGVRDRGLESGTSEASRVRQRAGPVARRRCPDPDDYLGFISTFASRTRTARSRPHRELRRYAGAGFMLRRIARPDLGISR